MSRSSEREPRRRLSRRQFLLGGSAALGGAALLAGCLNPAPHASGKSIGRVVIVGGGFGGATAAKYLRLWGGNIEVTLVEREAQFVSCPMSNLVLTGQHRMADITRRYRGLDRHGVKRVRGEAVAVDAAARQLRLADGRSLSYDRLLLSPGVDFMFEQVPGLNSPASQAQVLHAWKAGAQTLALRRQLEAMRDGGVYALTIPRSPYRCPPGPYERACLVAHYLKLHKPRSKVLVLDANAEIQSKKSLFSQAFEQHYAGLLEYVPDSELRAVDTGRQTARLDFEDVRADVLNVVPPQSAGALAHSAGVVNVNKRWVDVDWLTMESKAVAGIHVIGDAVAAAPAMPKSGHMANQQAKVAAAAIIQLLRGEPVSMQPMLNNTCYSFVDPEKAMHIASVHRYDAKQATVLPVAGAGGVSAAPSPLEARHALAWAHNIWADMLG